MTQFSKYSVLFLVKDLILLLMQGGSLSSMLTISFGIKLLIILRMAFVRMEVFLPARLSKNALSQLKPQLPYKSYQHLHCYNAKHVFHTGDGEKSLN